VVNAETARLRALSYEDLPALLDDSIHYRVPSRTGRVLEKQEPDLQLAVVNGWLFDNGQGRVTTMVKSPTT
jgi:hypothetical protein